MRSVLLVTATLLLSLASVARADLTITMGGEWKLTSRVVAQACVAGNCDTDRARRTDTVFLPAGSIVRIALQVFSCGSIELTDYCDLSPRRLGKMVLVDCDKSALGPLLRSCSPYPSLRLRRVGGFERMAADGKSFKWKAVVAFTLRVSGQTVAVTVIVTVDGALIAAGVTSGDVAPVTLDVAPGTPALVESLLGRVVGR